MTTKTRVFGVMALGVFAPPGGARAQTVPPPPAFAAPKTDRLPQADWGRFENAVG